MTKIQISVSLSFFINKWQKYKYQSHCPFSSINDKNTNITVLLSLFINKWQKYSFIVLVPQYQYVTKQNGSKTHFIQIKTRLSCTLNNHYLPSKFQRYFFSFVSLIVFHEAYPKKRPGNYVLAWILAIVTSIFLVPFYYFFYYFFIVFLPLMYAVITHN